MFETLEMVPADPILGLTEAFNEDTNPEKINLGVGVYKDADGKTPIFSSVQKVEATILQKSSTKNYMPIGGDADYATAVQQLLFGKDHEIVTGGRAVTVHTPGGTGGLRLAGDFVHKLFPNAKIWVSDPTWANHAQVFQHAGLEVETYPYFDAASNGLAFDVMIAGLEKVPAGDVVLLHGCCHNPTGIDPDKAQWEAIADVAASKGWLPFVDFAYQGLGDGLESDGEGLSAMARPGAELLVSSSFSKNFGLYNERTGALSIVTGSSEDAARARSQVLICIRSNYSNPPAHGAAIVTKVLNDSGLYAQWESEVRDMRDRINQMRRLFVDTLERQGVKRDFSFIARQRGMFSFSGLKKDQVDRLREDYSIYIVGSGRINVAGMTEANMDRLCGAIAEVLETS